jgi:hypothetical protein
MPAAGRAFEALLALYPADYRARFAAEMRATFGASIADPAAPAWN